MIIKLIIAGVIIVAGAALFMPETLNKYYPVSDTIDAIKGAAPSLDDMRQNIPQLDTILNPLDSFNAFFDRST